ncbi:acyl dehydratase [Rhodococcus sp. RS1C4]|nr:acyl dehydratase [Rhodococcus sp. RS1C4]
MTMSTVSLIDHEVSEPRSIRDLVGAHHFATFTYEVGREKIREFARAVHDDHPAHVDDAAGHELGHDGIIAPVTFVAVIGAAVLPELFENLLIGYGLKDILHSDQQILLHRTIRTGDILGSDLCLESFRQAGGSDIMVTRNEICDSAGEPVVTTRTTFVARTDERRDNGVTAADDGFGSLLDGIMRRGG